MGPRRFCLINVPTYEIWEIQTHSLDHIMTLVMDHFHRNQTENTDAQFLNELRNSSRHSTNANPKTVTSSCSSSAEEFSCDMWFKSTKDVMNDNNPTTIVETALDLGSDGSISEAERNNMRTGSVEDIHSTDIDYSSSACSHKESTSGQGGVNRSRIRTGNSTESNSPVRKVIKTELLLDEGFAAQTEPIVVSSSFSSSSLAGTSYDSPICIDD